MTLQVGAEQDYRQRHDRIWPEMVAALQRAGFRNYSIYRDQTDLFGYFEADDVAETIRAIGADPTNARWAKMMTDILVTVADPGTGFPRPLTEEFHLE